jgi:hypothetical protein
MIKKKRKKSSYEKSFERGNENTLDIYMQRYNSGDVDFEVRKEKLKRNGE